MHAYENFAHRQFWSRAVADQPWEQVLAGESGKFRLSPQDRISSAGSCFAQRIATRLRDQGYGYAVFEACHPLQAAQAAALGYGTYSCRYGNIYTLRQLRQLVDECFERRDPIVRLDRSAQGDAVIDLMRPRINRIGFETETQALADRIHHLLRTRAMFEHSQVFVFTLGLTEIWWDAQQQVCYGMHPSVVTGRAWRETLAPLNLDYNACINDFAQVYETLMRHNPTLRIILTVSPVALAATHQDQHVLLATMYSKSVLRAVAGRLADELPNVAYFPSYEIFNAAQSFGQYLATDLREVNARGVQVAMDTFSRLFLSPPVAGAAPAVRDAATPAAEPPAEPSPADRECDEMANAVFG